MRRYFALFLIAAGLAGGCGSGNSSSDTGLVVKGTLFQGGAAGHALLSAAKHGAGEPLEEISICVNEKCTTTSDEGEWGVFLEDHDGSGDLLIAVAGHGIDTTLTVPATSSTEMQVELLRDGNVVEAASIIPPPAGDEGHHGDNNSDHHSH